MSLRHFYIFLILFLQKKIENIISFFFKIKMRKIKLISQVRTIFIDL